MKRRRVVLGLAAAAMAACGGSAADTVGDAMIDAGEWLSDAGAVVRDAMGSDARAMDEAGASLEDARVAPEDAAIDRRDATGVEDAAEDSGPRQNTSPIFAPRIVLRDGNGDPVEALVTWAWQNGDASATSTSGLSCVRIMVWGQDLRPSVHKLSDGTRCDDAQDYIAGRLANGPYALAVEYD